MLFLFILFAFSSFSQKNQIKHLNIDNSAKLKIVFQKYIIESRTYYEESKFPLLKVNDKYLDNNNTGIDKVTFENYLSNCPKALSMANLGLQSYDKASRLNTTGTLSSIAIYIAAGYLAYKGYDTENQKYYYYGGGLALGGLVGSYIFGKLSDKKINQANEQIISAFDIYDKACFKPAQNEILIPKLDTVHAERRVGGEVKNGDFNDKEKVKIEVIEDKVDKALIGCSISSGIQVMNSLILPLTGELFYFKKGLYFNVNGMYGWFNNTEYLNDIETPTNYNVGVDVTLPFLKKNIFNALPTALGNAYGVNFTGLLDQNVMKSYGIDAGVKYNKNSLGLGSDETILLENGKQINAAILLNQSVFLKLGPSITFYNNISYKVDDIRFEKTAKTQRTLLKIYVNALYNVKPSYVNFMKNAEISPSKLKQLGGIMGIDTKVATKTIGYKFNLEFGLYPTIDGLTSFGGNLSLGLLLVR